MASHAGNWELLGAALAMNGYPLISVAQEQNSKSADTFINEYRALMKQHVTYKTGIRDMVRFLRDGHYIGLLMDQDPGYAGIMVKLFGKDTLTADGPAKLAGIDHYPIICTFIHEDRPFHHVIDVTPPIRPYERGKNCRKKKSAPSSTTRRSVSTISWNNGYGPTRKTGSGSIIAGNGRNGMKKNEITMK